MPRALSLLALSFCLALPAVPALAQDHSGHMAMAAAPVRIGSIEISGAFTRATLPNAPVAGGFFTLTNTGTQEDRLVSASSTIARDTQIHEMAMQGDVMKMRPLADGLTLPAGATVALEPGGYHLMFFGLNQALVEGETVAVTLHFETAGEITIDLPVASAAADAPAGQMGH